MKVLMSFNSWTLQSWAAQLSIMLTLILLLFKPMKKMQLTLHFSSGRIKEHINGQLHLYSILTGTSLIFLLWSTSSPNKFKCNYRKTLLSISIKTNLNRVKESSRDSLDCAIVSHSLMAYLDVNPVTSVRQPSRCLCHLKSRPAKQTCEYPYSQVRSGLLPCLFLYITSCHPG